MSNQQAIIRQRIETALQLKQALLNDTHYQEVVEMVVQTMCDCYRFGGKVLFCGNGGSAADAQHLAAELSCRFYTDRQPLNAEALHVNTSYLTATANDYDFTEVYAKAVEAKGESGDILVALSTSGNSPNVVKALQQARKMDIMTVGFTGQKKGAMDQHCDYLLKMPSEDTPRIQELHILTGHIICELVEAELFPG